ncbi:MAG TPA: cytochrome c3 family protein [Candidatus Eisenbacteria bacterium]|nr:cytochrome c3 family protein [Candidatus Eisenbacteria bacterium]
MRPSTNLRRVRARTAAMPGIALLASLAALSLGAGPGPHRTSAEITKVLAAGPHAGECESCHAMHGPEGQFPELHALIGPDDNSLCDRCHTAPWSGGSYFGPMAYSQSAHGSSNSTVWPGPAPPPRTEPGATGKCLNCHDPHGLTDAQGEVPGLRLLREESLCLTCHDGTPAQTDIASDYRLPFRHPTGTISGIHTGPTESLPTDFGASPLDRRHAECEDCHNPHLAYHDPPGLPQDADISKVNLGVSRVRVLNGGPGAPPTFYFVAAADTLSPALTEYEVCFKCHSSWTTQPTGQTDFARVLNPANPSYHPVEAPGRNPNIAFGAFTPGWTPSSITRCDSCHGSDLGTNAGPHGSNNRFILRAPYVADSQDRMMLPTESCFACHAYDVYANASSPASVQTYSRFNEPGAGKGHTKHVDENRVPCYACHTTHGSTTLPHLLVTGRTPGIQTITVTATGGTCSPSCHGTQSYTVNYAR